MFFLHYRVTDFVVPAGIKWKSLFEECRNDLEGQTSYKEPELSVWKNIEKSILRTRSSDIRRRCTRKRGKEEDPAVNVAEKKEVNCYDISEIQNYLGKVCLKLHFSSNLKNRKVYADS